MEDVGAIAVRNLEDRNARIRTRAIARAVIKFLLAQKVGDTVGDKNNENLGLIVRTILQAASAATEVADKRAWRTLPDRILMARLSLPAGDQSLSLRFFDEKGILVETREVKNVTMTSGRKSFVIVRTAL